MNSIILIHMYSAITICIILIFSRYNYYNHRVFKECSNIKLIKRIQ